MAAPSHRPPVEPFNWCFTLHSILHADAAPCWLNPKSTLRRPFRSCGIGRVGPISEGSASMARSYISLGFPAPTSICSAYSILLPCRFVLVVAAASFLFFAVVIFNSFCPARKVVPYSSLLGLQAWRPCSLRTVGREIWTENPAMHHPTLILAAASALSGITPPWFAHAAAVYPGSGPPQACKLNVTTCGTTAPTNAPR